MDVGCLRCEMFKTWDVGQNVGDVGCLECGYSGCGILSMWDVENRGC